jgi:hypothetical protein
MSRFAPSVFKKEFHNFPAARGINRRFSPAEILPYGMSRKILFFFDDVKILYNYMFSYLSCQVNELYIIVEVM